MMGTITRGVRNVFRNTIRAFSVTLILGISISLALVMLLAYQTVQEKIESVKASIGNTITLTPAGAQGFQGGGEPPTDEQMTTIRGLSNVVGVDETLQDRLTSGVDTSLVSAIDAGTLGTRFGNQERRNFDGQAMSSNRQVTGASITVPIQVTGLSNPSTLTTGDSQLISGELFDGESTDNLAVIGSGLATKNDLSAGSNFTAYGDTTFTVVGIYDAGNTFANAGIYLPIKTLQTLSDQINTVSRASVSVNTIENVSSVVAEIQQSLGGDKVDVVSNQDRAMTAIAPLENIKTISFSSLVGALIAGAVIMLLTMTMIVRERRYGLTR
jgi:putative ABC transport system permease protein